MSKDYEHQISNNIDRATNSETRSFRIGFSGSSAKPNSDVLVTTPRECYAIELKHSVKDRRYIDSEDVEQLVECENSYTSVWLTVKFSHREPVTVRYYGDVTNGPDDWDERTPVERFAALFPEPFDGHVTPEGNLRVDKPETDEWTSARAGVDDHLAILRDMGVPSEVSTHV